MECLGADEHDCALLVVFANSFANAGAADTRSDDKVIATNHVGVEIASLAARLLENSSRCGK